MRHPLFCAAFALALALPASARAATYSAAFSGPALDPNLGYAISYGFVNLGVAGGVATLGQAAHSGPGQAIVSTKFTVAGNFSATITGDFTGFAPTSNLAGNQEAGVFQANFNAGGVASAFGVSDENFAVGLGDNLNNTSIEKDFFHSGGDYVNSFRITRLGGVVSILVAEGAGPFQLRQMGTAPGLLGPVGFEFYFQNGNNNPGAGHTGWSNFTITADQFNGLKGGGGVPEPAAWLLMIGGFGLTGARLRSRRRHAM